MNGEYLTHEYDPQLRIEVSLMLVTNEYWKKYVFKKLYCVSDNHFLKGLPTNSKEILADRLHKIAFSQQEREPMCPKPMID